MNTVKPIRMPRYFEQFASGSLLIWRVNSSTIINMSMKSDIRNLIFIVYLSMQHFVKNVTRSKTSDWHIVIFYENENNFLFR